MSSALTASFLSPDPSNRLFGLLYQISRGFSPLCSFPSSHVSPLSFPPERLVAPGDVVDPETRYCYAHGLYSLSIALLEIARWWPLDASADLLRDSSAEERR